MLAYEAFVVLNVQDGLEPQLFVVCMGRCRRGTYAVMHLLQFRERWICQASSPKSQTLALNLSPQPKIIPIK